MSEVLPTSYDEVPYESKSFPQSHPDRLATIATLFGMQPPPVENCRVLELGCGSGRNILSMAVGLPKSTFVGIDYSSRQIEEGQEFLAQLGSENIELLHRNISDIDPDFGRFDYIIAHGVYSWISEDLQEKLLEVCSANLEPNGVAYVSYNTYPGWHLRNIIRDLMLFHTNSLDASPPKVVHEARKIVDFLAQSVPKEKNPYQVLLEGQSQLLARRNDSYIFHEYLEEVNDPVYFSQFAEQARSKGLRYLGEADFSSMFSNKFSPEVARALDEMASDIISYEQYLDFVLNRFFRKTLLCHQEIQPQRRIRPEILTTMHIGSFAQQVQTDPDASGPGVESFRGPTGKMETSNSLLKEALNFLFEVWPQVVPFEELLNQIHQRRGKSAGKPNPGRQRAADRKLDREELLLAELLLKCLSTDLIELRVRCPGFVLESGTRPLASPLARLQARKETVVTNLRLESVTLTQTECSLLRNLDGAHSREQLTDLLAGAVENGTLEIKAEDESLPPDPSNRSILGGILELYLKKTGTSGSAHRMNVERTVGFWHGRMAGFQTGPSTKQMAGRVTGPTFSRPSAIPVRKLTSLAGRP